MPTCNCLLTKSPGSMLPLTHIVSCMKCTQSVCTLLQTRWKLFEDFHSLLGLLNYYGKFLPNLATILHPLHLLLQQNRKWRWIKACDRAFQQDKEVLTNSQVLVHYCTHTCLGVASPWSLNISPCYAYWVPKKGIPTLAAA